MKFKEEIIINAPVATTWEILGNQFGEAYKWASGIKHSKSYGEPRFPKAHCNNRTCELSNGKINEVIRKFDTSSYELEYEVIKGFPFFVEYGINNWKLEEQKGKTKVTMDLNIKTKGILGSIMAPMMKMQMSKLVKEVPNDLKVFVETGNPSPNKQKEIKKLA